MKKQTDPRIRAHLLRSAFYLLLAVGVIPFALSSAISLPKHTSKVNGHESDSLVAASVPRRERTLTFADRVAYQRAIEDVYWRHRIWPRNGGANPGPKPSLDQVMPQAQIEKKVEDYLRNSQLLEDYWQRPITPEQLQAEMERMARHSRKPEVLRELFAALGNDPYVIAECLARPVLAARLVDELMHHAEDGDNATLKSDAETPRTPTPKAFASPKDYLRKPEDVMWFREAFGVRAACPPVCGRPRVALGLYPSVRRISLTAQDEVGRARNLARAEAQVPTSMAAVTVGYTLPVLSGQSNDSIPSINCTDNTWTPTSTTGAPDAREGHTAMWTGSEMIVWGGDNGSLPFFNSGGRYDPATDSWTATTTTNAPGGRAYHTAVWTGSQMIIWGGYDGSGLVNTGGRYNPSADSWTATSTTGAPTARSLHTAVWTGSEMIAWGGSPDGGFSRLNTGGRYNPTADTWTATSITGAPDARVYHTAVWTGSEMIVWGGNCGFICDLNTGGRYDPTANNWTATSTTNAPTARSNHSAVWTGSQMIVWGGGLLNTGGRYDPIANSWTTTSTTNAPSGRGSHTAVWTGGEMIVWGGNDGNSLYVNTGGRYDRSTDSWVATSLINPPEGRDGHTAVWTGSQMIVWGGYGYTDCCHVGYHNTGGRYCVGAPTPTPTPTPCEGRCSPTPRPTATATAPRPTPPPHLTPPPTPSGSPLITPAPRPTPPPHLTPVPPPPSPRPTPWPRP